MDGLLKELGKLEKLTGPPYKGKASLNGSLDSMLEALREAKASIETGNTPKDVLPILSETVDQRKKEIDNHQKEVYSSLSRFGKALDKKFSTPLPSYSPLFTSDEAKQSLERTIAVHFLRTGQFGIAESFMEESGVQIPPKMRSHFVELDRIVTALRNRDISPALEWASKHRSFLQARSSPLEFHLHRSQYLRLLLSTHPPNPSAALEYANTALQPFYASHTSEFQKLIACMAYLPLTKLQSESSPYKELASPSLHLDLEPLFAKEYCASLGMSRQVPLKVLCDIAGGGALAKIEKGRKVMRERKSEWSQTDELPIEIPLAAENRYHSIFACPVSKDQSTDGNPPMMMSCGHVISRDSLNKLQSKHGGRVKCPYCPTESQLNAAIRVYF